MKAEEEWSAAVGTETAKVSRTSLFFGHQKRVLAAHFKGPSPEERLYMVYTELLDRPIFDALLASMRFVPVEANK